MLSFSKKQMISVALSVVVGVSSAFMYKKAEAAILVYDAANVAQAIETAITTANILTEEQKKLALMLVNYQKYKPEEIGEYVFEHASGVFGVKKSKNPLEGDKDYLSGWKFDTQWAKQLGVDIQAVVNGQKTVADLYFQRQDAHKAVNELIKSTVEKIQTSAKQDKKTLEKTTDAVKKEPAGEVQAIQQNGIVAANNAQILANGNEIARTALNLQILEAEQKQLERAEAEAVNKQQKNAAASLVGNAKVEWR